MGVPPTDADGQGSRADAPTSAPIGSSASCFAVHVHQATSEIGPTVKQARPLAHAIPPGTDHRSAAPHAKPHIGRYVANHFCCSAPNEWSCSVPERVKGEIQQQSIVTFALI